MHPASTALLILGYALAVPIGFRLGTVISDRQRLAFTGHQVGMALAAGGWILRGSTAIAVGHVLWLIGTRIWYQFGHLLWPLNRDKAA